MRPLVLLSDFGLDDYYTGTVHAVLARDAAESDRIDLTHSVPPGDIWEGCFQLRCAWPYLPQQAIVLAVVDPSVGSSRRALAVRIESRWLVAPDNGLAAAVGPATEAWVLDPQRMGLPAPSATFHGRDVFAPAAARLARGESAVVLGTPASPQDLQSCPLPDPQEGPNGLIGTVLHIDRFGNIITNLQPSQVPKRGVIRSGAHKVDRRVRAYCEAPDNRVVFLTGSTGKLELAMNRGSAAQKLGLNRGDHIEVVASAD
jgi:S-adenosylmethionine hydrolase